MTVTERVHLRLRQARGGWVCGLRLADPACGGLRAAARVHDLRRQGVAIQTKPCDCMLCRERRVASKRAGRRFAPVAAYMLTDWKATP